MYIMNNYVYVCMYVCMYVYTSIYIYIYVYDSMNRSWDPTATYRQQMHVNIHYVHHNGAHIWYLSMYIYVLFIYALWVGPPFTYAYIYAYTYIHIFANTHALHSALHWYMRYIMWYIYMHYTEALCLYTYIYICISRRRASIYLCVDIYIYDSLGGWLSGRLACQPTSQPASLPAGYIQIHIYIYIYTFIYTHI